MGDKYIHEKTLETAGVKNKPSTSREAIAEAAEQLFLKHGFGGVNMDDLAEAAGVARRTLYNQFSSKEEIFREVLARRSAKFGAALPSDIEAGPDAEQALRRVAHAVISFYQRPNQLAFVRMVIGDSRQFPWLGEAFVQASRPHIDRLIRYMVERTETGELNCPKPEIAAYQFMGMLKEALIWPQIMDAGSKCRFCADEAIEEALTTFLMRYRRDKASGQMTDEKKAPAQ